MQNQVSSEPVEVSQTAPIMLHPNYIGNHQGSVGEIVPPCTVVPDRTADVLGALIETVEGLQCALPDRLERTAQLALHALIRNERMNPDAAAVRALEFARALERALVTEVRP